MDTPDASSQETPPEEISEAIPEETQEATPVAPPQEALSTTTEADPEAQANSSDQTHTPIVSDAQLTENIDPVQSEPEAAKEASVSPANDTLTSTPEPVPNPEPVPAPQVVSEASSEASVDKSAPLKKPQALLTIYALSALHPGTGEASRGIQYPILRDKSDLPMIAASGIKGALRKQIRDGLYEKYKIEAEGQGEATDWKTLANQDSMLIAMFGTREAPFSGLTFSPAQLLAYPLRALQGLWGWVTSPRLLKPYLHALDAEAQLQALTSLKANECLTASECPLQIEEKRVILEELEFKPIGNWGVLGIQLQQSLNLSMLEPDWAQRLIIISDEQMAYIARYQTRIDTYHNQGKSQSIEQLPAEALFYTPFFEENTDKLNSLRAQLGDLISLGSHITVGQGLCQVAFAHPSTEKAVSHAPEEAEMVSGETING